MVLLILTVLFILPLIFNLPLVSAASDPAKISDLNTVIANLIRVSVALVGALTAVMLVVGGLKYLMAGGDKDAMAKAQHTITYAIIGLLVAACAWLIVSFLGTFLGIPLNTFSIFIP